ncbi:unnamed protein product [Amoebophrya sp. A120]|nr:unnamed protein product [Amoebophrya sp. A120]|eukprot:GSA120T00004639001.1
MSSSVITYNMFLQLIHSGCRCKRGSQRTLRRKKLVARIQEKLGFVLGVKDDGINRAEDQDQDEDFCSSQAGMNTKTTESSSTSNIKMPETKICGVHHLDSESTKKRLQPVIAVLLVAAFFLNVVDTVKQPAGREDIFGFFSDEDSGDGKKPGGIDERQRSGKRNKSQRSSHLQEASAEDREVLHDQDKQIRGTVTDVSTSETAQEEGREPQFYPPRDDEQPVIGAVAPSSSSPGTARPDDPSGAAQTASTNGRSTALQVKVQEERRKIASSTGAFERAPTSTGYKRLELMRDVGEVLQGKMKNYEDACTETVRLFSAASAEDETAAQAASAEHETAPQALLQSVQEPEINTALLKFCKLMARIFVRSLPFYFYETLEERQEEAQANQFYVPPLFMGTAEEGKPVKPSVHVLNTLTVPGVEDTAHIGGLLWSYQRNTGYWDFIGPTKVSSIPLVRDFSQSWQNLYDLASLEDEPWRIDLVTEFLDKNEDVKLDGSVSFGSHSFRKILHTLKELLDTLKEHGGDTPKELAGLSLSSEDVLGLEGLWPAQEPHSRSRPPSSNPDKTLLMLENALSAVLQTLLHDALYALACAVDGGDCKPKESHSHNHDKSGQKKLEGGKTSKLLWDLKMDYQQNRLETFWRGISTRKIKKR